MQESLENLDSLTYAQLFESFYLLSEQYSDEIWKAYFLAIMKKIGIVDGNNTDITTAFNAFTEKKNLVNKATQEKLVFDSKKTIGDNINLIKKFILLELYDKSQEEANNIRGDRVKDGYHAYAYMVYYENDKESQMHAKNILPENPTLSQIHEYMASKYNIKKEVMQGVRNNAQKLQIFDQETEFFGVNFSESQQALIKSAYSAGLRFRKDPSNLQNIFVFTKDGHFIDSISHNNIEQLLPPIIAEYQYHVLQDNLKTLTIDREVDVTPGYISDDSGLKRLAISQKYLTQLQIYEEAGYKFEVTNLSNNGYANIRVLHGDSVVAEVNGIVNNGQKANLWAELLLKSLHRYEKGGSQEKKPDYKEDPGKRIDQNIEFINQIEKVHTYNFDHLFSIGYELKMPIKQILEQIRWFYAKQMRFIAPTIQDFFRFLPNDFDQFFSGKFHLHPKEYSEVKHAFIELLVTTIREFIQYRPDYALKGAENLADHMISWNVHLNNYIPNDIEGVSNHLLFVIRQALYADPSLQESYDYKRLVKKYPGVDRFLKNVNQELQTRQNRIGGRNTNAFENAQDVEGDEDIARLQKRFQDNWFSEYPGFPEDEKKHITHYPLMVARNIYLQFSAHNNSDQLDSQTDEQLKKMVLENLDLIFRLRQSYANKKIFAQQDMFYIAHYGQDVKQEGIADAFGRTETQTALQYHVGVHHNFRMLDGEKIYTKDDEEIRMDLDRFLDEFVNNPGPAQIFLEGHANGEGFSFVHKTEKRDNLGINEKGQRIIDISPDKIVSLIQQRDFVRKQHKITEPDTITFMACRGDYALNTLSKAFQKSSNNNYMDFPIFMTAAEFGQDSWYKPGEKVPNNFLRDGLNIENKDTILYEKFFQNGNYNEKIGSNPVLFIPVEIDGKIIPQQIG